MREKVSWEPDTFFQVIFWLWRLCQGHHDSVVHVYQGPCILASVNGMGIYPRTSLSKFTVSIYEAIGCTVVLGIVGIFLFYHWVQISVLLLVFLFCICNALDGWLGNGPYGGTGDQSLLKFLIYSLYSFTIRCMISTYFFFYCWLSFQPHCTLMHSSL